MLHTIDTIPVHELDITTPGFALDPMRVYKRLQAESPVHRRPTGGQVWILTRHQDCVAALAHPAARVTGVASQPLPPALERVSRTFFNSMLFRDPPDHTRLRGLVSKGFTPKRIEALRPRITALTHQLLDQMATKAEADLVGDFAFQLPALVICELLGVPAEQRDEFRLLSNTMMQGNGADATPERRMAGLQATVELAGFFDRLIAQRQAEPQDDLITALIRVEEAGDSLDYDELVGTLCLLLVAGHETTTNLISAGTLALLEQPEALAAFRSAPEIVETAVEELLRFTSPVQRMGRQLSESTTFSGVAIPAGGYVIAVMAAANRDPVVFPDPDRLDLRRNPNPHLGLGRGIHYCLGAPLARLEASIAFPLLLERFPNLRLTGEPIWHPASIIRGLQRLPLALR